MPSCAETRDENALVYPLGDASNRSQLSDLDPFPPTVWRDRHGRRINPAASWSSAVEAYAWPAAEPVNRERVPGSLALPRRSSTCGRPAGRRRSRSSSRGSPERPPRETDQLDAEALA